MKLDPSSDPLGELRNLLQHPAATDDLQRAALQELVRLATQDRGSWMIGLAGVLLPGLREIAGSAPPIDARVASSVEADVLDRFRNAIHQPALDVVEFAMTVMGSCGPIAVRLERPVGWTGTSDTALGEAVLAVEKW